MKLGVSSERRWWLSCLGRGEIANGLGAALFDQREDLVDDGVVAAVVLKRCLGGLRQGWQAHLLNDAIVPKDHTVGLTTAFK